MKSKIRASTFWPAIMAMIVLTWSAANRTGAADPKKTPKPVDSGASLIRYEIRGGESFFALSLKVGALPASTGHDHVILVDTSASQAGAHRRQALAVLQGFLKALDASDRVRLIAFDVKVNALSDGFHPPQAAETQEALAKLQRIVPLGATDLKAALDAALKSFAGDRGRSITYIGDGMSTARLVPVPELRELVSALRKARIPVSSFAVGPRTDLQMLGVLAEHTGGVVFIDALIDDTQVPAEQVGQTLAAAAAATVFYPDRISLTPEVDQLLPSAIPPLRADRDTILLGKGFVGGDVKVTVTGAGPTLAWTVKPAAPQPGNTFLVALWGMAERTDGLAVAVAGQELLGAARQEFEDNLLQLVAQGRQAVATRDLKLAEQIADTIRQVDPANVEAQTIMNAVQKARAAAAALDKEKSAIDDLQKAKKKK